MSRMIQNDNKHLPTIEKKYMYKKQAVNNKKRIFQI